MPTMAAKDYPSLVPAAWPKEQTHTKPASKASPAKLSSDRQSCCARRLLSPGAPLTCIAPYTPEQNGLCERFIRIFKEECA
jgi:hypothetical protein